MTPVTLAKRLASLEPWQQLTIAAAVIVVLARLLFDIDLGMLPFVAAGPVTLAQAALGASSDIDRNVIDEFRKSSYIFDAITFDDVVNPAGGGATLTYGYQRLVTQPTAAFRAINAEYTPQEATKAEFTVSLKPFGGSFQIDRVLAAIARAKEVAFQIEQKAKAARALFNDAFINGDSAVDANSFDGLDKALTGTATEIAAASLPSAGVWSGTFDEAKAFTIMDDVDYLLSQLDGPASAILANKRVLLKLAGAARRSGYLTQTEDAFGRAIDSYRNIPLIDPGEKAGSTTEVIPVATGAEPGAGKTDIYAVRFGLDGLHGISLAGQSPVRQWLPDFTTAGAVKTGEVEMVAAIALKATKAAAVARDVDLSA